MMFNTMAMAATSAGRSQARQRGVIAVSCSWDAWRPASDTYNL